MSSPFAPDSFAPSPVLDGPRPICRGAGIRGPAALLGGLALVVLGACRTTEQATGVSEMVRRGAFEEAVTLASERAEAAPDDPARQAELELALQAFWLDRGRRASFRGDHAAALDAFLEARAVRPQSEITHRWVEKTLQELALRESTRAKELEAQGQLELAYHAYLAAEEFWPFDPAHRAGASRMLLLANYRDGLGDAYFLAGARALERLALPQARQGFDAANKHRPGDPLIVDRREEVARLFAEERSRIGEDLEQEGLFRAAHNEFRLALLYSPDHAEALEGLERTQTEVTVLDLLEEADRLILRRDFTLASERIERAARRTVQQQERVERRRDGLTEARRKHLYDRARELESDFRFPEAIAAYEELLAEAQFYLDAITRRDVLRSYIANAERLYLEASREEDFRARLDLLRRIQLFWPTYRDVRAQVSELERQAS